MDTRVVREFIFYIDRSGSMYNTIILARAALVLFLYSLPAGSRFNICSYGSKYEYMFSQRSVEYNDENIKLAVSQVETFTADFGGTQIYEPIKAFYDLDEEQSVNETHMMLLTDGAVWDTNQIVNLVKSKSSLSHRFHTFGVGHGASEDLIKRVALDGFGQYYFIYDEEEIEQNVVTAI